MVIPGCVIGGQLLVLLFLVPPRLVLTLSVTPLGGPEKRCGDVHIPAESDRWAKQADAGTAVGTAVTMASDPCSLFLA